MVGGRLISHVIMFELRAKRQITDGLGPNLFGYMKLAHQALAFQTEILVSPKQKQRSSASQCGHLPTQLFCPKISDAMSSEPLQIEHSDEGILRLKGPLTTENLPSFLNAMRREDALTMILDLSEVPYIDSAGLGTLISTYVSCQKAGRRIVLSGVNKRVLKLFEITKTEPLFLMFPTVWDAVETLTNAGRA